MSFKVEILPDEKDVFKQSDDECEQLAKTLRLSKQVFFDLEFHDVSSIITKVRNATGYWVYSRTLTTWCLPREIAEQEHGKWCLYDDPWPFHVGQGTNLDNNWLIAVIQTIARKRELLEHILPMRDYTKDCGIVQVRLFVDGKWQVIKIDFFLPAAKGKSATATTYRNQFWVAFIVKAYAKVHNHYVKMLAGNAKVAFECLTGCKCTRIGINKKANPDLMWRHLIENLSCSRLMVASTPLLQKGSDEKKMLYEMKLKCDETYSILDFKTHDDNQLILIGSTGTDNHKNEFLPIYSEEIHNKLSAADQLEAEKRLFWFRIQDFIRYFDYLYICEYKEPMFEKRFLQQAKKTDSCQSEVLCLHIKKRQKIAFEVCSAGIDDKYRLPLILNIHREATNDNCGELIQCFYQYDIRLTTEPMFLDPGTYSLFFVSDRKFAGLSLKWHVRSPTSLDSVAIFFNLFPQSVFIKSLQTMIAKNGTVENNKKDNIVIYKLLKEKNAHFMMENSSEANYVRVNMNLSEKWLSIPPMSRSIIAIIPVSDAEKYDDFKIKYQICSWYKNPLNWFYDSPVDQLECPIPLN